MSEVPDAAEIGDAGVKHQRANSNIPRQGIIVTPDPKIVQPTFLLGGPFQNRLRIFYYTPMPPRSPRQSWTHVIAGHDAMSFIMHSCYNMRCRCSQS